MKKTKVVVFGLTSNMGGIENFYLNYYRKFNFDLIDVSFICAGKSMAYEQEIKINSKIYYVENWKNNIIKYYKSVKKVLKDNKFDIAHINMLSCANIIPAKLCRKAKIKEIIIHSHNGNVPKGILRKILNKVNKNKLQKISTLNLSCSDLAGKWMFSNKPFRILPNQISFSKFSFDMKKRIKIRAMYGIAEDTVVYGHVGRFSEQKNQIFLINIINTIRTINRDVKFVFIGDGELIDNFKIKMRELGLSDFIIFTGMIPNTADYYNAFDCFLLPSLFEGLPLVALEAQVNQLPCFVSEKISPEVKISKNIEMLKLVETDWIEKLRNIKARKVFSLNVDKQNLDKKYDADCVENELMDIYLK